VRNCIPDERSQSFRLSSTLPVANIFPSGLKAIDPAASPVCRASSGVIRVGDWDTAESARTPSKNTIEQPTHKYDRGFVVVDIEDGRSAAI
jgi:hypothetical protein